MNDVIPDCVYSGIEILTREYIVTDCEDHEAEKGVVELLFDKSLIDRLMSHKGAHLVIEYDESQNISSKPVVGLSIFHTDDTDFPDEAEDIASIMKDYSPIAWWFYVIVNSKRKSKETRLNLVKKSFDILREAGCRFVVADYMIKPVVCLAGKRLMDELEFEDTGRIYGNGLKGLGNDVYRIMMRDVNKPLAIPYV